MTTLTYESGCSNNGPRAAGVGPRLALGPTGKSAVRLQRVAIVLPVYNGEGLLHLAIDSILAQSYTDYELIICDNASTDRTQEICREYAARDSRIRYHRNPANIGAARNFNRTFELSRSPYFKWMAHDDVVLPTMIAQCVEALDRNREVVACTVRRRYMTYEGRVRTEDPAEDFHNLTLPQIFRVDGSRFPAYMMGVMRREALLHTRLMDTYVASEVVFVVELRLQGQLWQLPEELHYQRLPDESRHRAVRKSHRGEAIFLDPLNATRRFLVPPGIKLLLEKANAILRAPIRPSRKGRHMLDLMEYIVSKVPRVLNPWEMIRYVTRNFHWATERLSESEQAAALGRSTRAGGRAGS